MTSYVNFNYNLQRKCKPQINAHTTESRTMQANNLAITQTLPIQIE